MVTIERVKRDHGETDGWLGIQRGDTPRESQRNRPSYERINATPKTF